MFRGTIYNDFISEDERKLSVLYLDSVENWEQSEYPKGRQIDETWSKRALWIDTIKSQQPIIGNMFYSFLDRMKPLIKESMRTDREVYANVTYVLKALPGWDHPVHSDSGEDTPAEDQFGHRDFGTVVYLSDNFTGGEIYYPEFNVSIMPKPRSLAIHPGDHEHRHGVRALESGVRYSLVTFWTYDQSRESENLIRGGLSSL